MSDPTSGVGTPCEAGRIDATTGSGLRPAPERGTIATTRARGRLSAAKLRALEELGPRFGVEAAGAGDAPVPLSTRLDAAFGRRTPRLLDVGVGNGAATLAWAEAHPDRDVVAVELHRPSLALLLAALDASGLPNVRIAEADVRTLLRHADPGSVHDVRILFPDPWPKRRHLARRLVDEAFVAGIALLLPVGGTLHVATDWPPYAAQVVRVARADGRFDVDPDAPRPDRPVTTYEALGLAAGRPVTDVVATRR